MKKYQLPKLVSMYGLPAPTEHNSVFEITEDGRYLSIPFDPANTDYANFKKDLADGAELLDAEGNVIDGIAYLEELV